MSTNKIMGTSTKKHRKTLGEHRAMHRRKYLWAATWEGLEHMRKELRAIEGVDKRCGEQGPRSKKVTLPHLKFMEGDEK